MFLVIPLVAPSSCVEITWPLSSEVCPSLLRARRVGPVESEPLGPGEPVEPVEGSSSPLRPLCQCIIVVVQRLRGAVLIGSASVNRLIVATQWLRGFLACATILLGIATGG